MLEEDVGGAVGVYELGVWGCADAGDVDVCWVGVGTGIGG